MLLPAARARRLVGVSLLAAIALQAPIAAVGAIGSPAHAASVASAKIADDDLQQLEAALWRAHQYSGAPGLSVGFLPFDGRQWRNVVGTHRDGTPLAPDDSLRIGSVTKTFTAAIVLALVDEGLLVLHDRVDRHLGPIAVLQQVTVRHLLEHTSGLGDLYGPLEGLLHAEPGRILSPNEVLGSVTSNGAPGLFYAYSNTNYYLLGMLIEAVTGRTFGEELERRYGEPLGLAHTRFVTAEDPALPPAWSTAFGASGAMVSTARDLARWGRALYGGGVLSRHLTHAMTDFESGRDYDIGAQRLILGTRRAYGHTGLLFDTTSMLVYLPHQRVSIAIIATTPTADLGAALVGNYGGPSILEAILAVQH